MTTLRAFSEEHKANMKLAARARTRAQVKFNQLPTILRLLSNEKFSKEEAIKYLQDFCESS